MDKKDTKIIKLKNDGKSLRQIAKQVGISHVAVKKRLEIYLPCCNVLDIFKRDVKSGPSPHALGF